MTIRKKLILSGSLIAVGAFLLLGASTFLTSKVEQEFKALTEQTLAVLNELEDIRFFGLRIVSSVNEKLLLDHLKSTNELPTEKSKASDSIKTELNLIMQGIDSYNKSFGRYSLYIKKYFPDEVKFKNAIEETGNKLIAAARTVLNDRKSLTMPGSMLEFKEGLEERENNFLKQIQIALVHEQNELEERIENVISNISTMQNWIWYCFIALMAGVVVANIFLSKNIIQRIENLRNVTFRISQGDLTARSQVSGRDELSDLATAFNTMASDLSQSIEERTKAEQRMTENQAELASVQHLNLMATTMASIAHELNQPLAAINNYVEGSLMRLRSGNYEISEIEKSLELASEQALRSGDILKSLRAMMQEGKQQKSSFDINQTIDNTLKMLENKTAENNITIDLALDPSLPLIHADQIQIQQVIINLIENSMEAMRRSALKKRSITIKTLMSDTGLIETHIQNTGPAIDRKLLTKAFDPFFTTKTDGLGMGLAICHSIIEAHRGRIWAISDNVAGTDFIFSFPINAGIKHAKN